MKKNRVLALSILACTLLAGCDENTFVSYDGKVGKADSNDTVLSVQDFYEDIKESYGGSVALDKLLERIARIEYTKDYNSEAKVELKDFTFENDGVKVYRTNAKFKEEIQKTFEDIVDGTSYLDDDGKFDKEELKEHIEEDHDVKVEAATTSFYLDDEIMAKLGYNYDEYIEEELIPSILTDYLYYDYLLGSSKYKGQFSSQYASKLEVLKVPYDTTSLNYRWNEALVSMLKAVTNGKISTFNFTSSYSDQSFYTFNSDCDLIVYNVTSDKVSYEVYKYNDTSKAAIDALYNSLFEINETSYRVEKTSLTDAVAAVSTLTKDSNESFVIDANTKPNQNFYEHIEKILIARDLWMIDREVVLARNYDYKNVSTLYDAMTASDKSECETFASTYSSSNSKPMKAVVKDKKISVQQDKYYTEPEYYTKSQISNILPDALSSLRGTSAKEVYSHLNDFGQNEGQFLVTKQTNTSPVYLDTSSSNYYVCEVSEYYGYYLNDNPLDTTSKYLSKVNYQIEAYQAGEYNEYSLVENEYVKGDAVKYAATDAKFESIIQLVQKSAENVLSDSIKKEAVVTLFEKYELEINDQDVYDLINSKYPDYFDDED